MIPPINWKKDRLLKRFLKNAAYLVSGNIINSVSGLIVVTLIARVLGTENFGTLVLIQTYILVIDRLVNFQSWQAVIKYGSHEITKNNNGEINKLLKFGFAVDFISALAGTLIAITGVYFASIWFEWERNVSVLAMFYSLTILFHIEGTPTGILRLFDKFRIFAFKDLFVSVSRLSLVVVFYFLHPSVQNFLVIYIVTEIAGHLLIFLSALSETRKKGITRIFKSDLKNIKSCFPKIWEFIWTTNLHGSIRMVTMEIDTLLIGGVLGKSAAGQYQIAKKFSSILNKLFQPLYKAIYPELTKLYASNKMSEFKHLILKSSLLAGTLAAIASVGFYFIGNTVISLTVGESYLGAFPIILFLMAAVSISTATFPLTPGLLALGKPKVAFNILLISTLVYFPVLIILLSKFGAVGGGIAYLVFYITWSSAMTLTFYKQLQAQKR